MNTVRIASVRVMPPATETAIRGFAEFHDEVAS